MNKGLYALYLIFFVLILVALYLFTGASILIYLDIASLLVIALFLTILSIFTTRFKRCMGYYKAVFNPDADRDLLEASSRYFGNFTLYTMLVGAVGFLTGIIAMLANLEDTASVGPNLAVALITLLYAALLCLMVFLPFKLSLDSRIRKG
ncbi:MAG: MotA/TolQ/ExbB proton channel family protein [Spirochaetales bacterium]|nr:MotA/TolQ/ExbB proton channel family protein [Spirochaetales bacterium]